MRNRKPRAKAESTIALINIVFLMLIFFMVAGTLSPPIDPDLELVNTRDLEGREPDYALIVTADGTLRYRGADVADATSYLASLGSSKTARILPDRAAPAPVLLEVAAQMKAGGAETVMIVTEKALE